VRSRGQQALSLPHHSLQLEGRAQQLKSVRSTPSTTHKSHHRHIRRFPLACYRPPRLERNPLRGGRRRTYRRRPLGMSDGRHLRLRKVEVERDHRRGDGGHFEVVCLREQTTVLRSLRVGLERGRVGESRRSAYRWFSRRDGRDDGSRRSRSLCGTSLYIEPSSTPVLMPLDAGHRAETMAKSCSTSFGIASFLPLALSCLSATSAGTFYGLSGD
jgi:hypothetical protein